jgi:hypothetical protein
VADWEKTGEAWFPNKSVLNNLSAKAIVSEALPEPLWEKG